jgi:hypothetical protein
MDEVKRGFKSRTISKNIKEKMEEWIKTLPEELRDPVRNSYIVTGGAIASMLIGDLPNDYDVYFKDGEVAKKVAEHYLEVLMKKTEKKEKDGEEHVPNPRINRIEAINHGNRVQIIVKSAGLLSDSVDEDEYKYFESQPVASVENYFARWSMAKKEDKPTYLPAFVTSNAITLHDGVQLIIRFVGEPSDIHTNFDFVHCTNWYTNGGGLVLQQAALESILAKELRYVGSKYPVCSLFRIRKFINRGWSITAGETFKIAYDCSKLNLNDIHVLEDQLVGVDAAYFNEVITKLKEYKGELDRTYLFEIINRVFDADTDI